MEVTLNIKQSTAIPARQKKAWGEFLDMLVERAEAELENEKELANYDLTNSFKGGDK